MRRRWVLRRSDEGAILIFALIIIAVVAVVTGALLAQGWTNFATTVAVRTVAGQAYAGDAAAKVAINDLVWGQSSTVPGTIATYPSGTPHGWVYDNNTDGTGCFGKAAVGGAALSQLTFPAVSTNSDGTTEKATVVCAPVFGTGLFGGGHGSHIAPPTSDPFARALTTVGTGTSGSAIDGIALKGLGAGTEIPMRGDIESHTFINVQAGTLRTNGTIVGTCTGSTIPACTTGYSAPGSVTAPLSSLPTLRDPTTMGCSFQPGYYNNGTALTTAVNNCSPNPAYFASGVYYFDFLDGNPWDIGATVIGGVPVTGHTSIPGACASPINATPAAPTSGVQFVFGASSSVQVEDTGHVELCGPYNGGAAPITIYQQQTDVTATLTAGPVPASTVTTLTSGSNDGFTPNPSSSNLQAALASVGSPTAKWKSTANGHTGELDLTNFSGLSAIPAGSTINSAKLNVTYTNGLSAGTGTFQALVTGQAGAVTIQPSGIDTDITTKIAGAFAAGAFSATNPRIQLQITNSKNNDTFQVDAATLSVTYTGPGLRKATNISFIHDHGGNFKGQFVVEGATYAPNGYISLTPGSTGNALVSFRWGIIAWGVNFKSLPSQVFGYPLVEIPDACASCFGASVTDVDLKVFLCTTSGPAPCPTTGSPSLSTRVQLTDGTDANGIVNPIPGQRQVQVLSWAEQR